MTAREPVPSPAASRSTSRPDLPQSGRTSRGTLTVADAAARLLAMFGMHAELMRVLAGQLMRVSEQEVKIELGHHLYYHACAAEGLRARLEELRERRAEERAVPRRLVTLAAEIELARNTPELLVAVHLFAGNTLIAAVEDYLAHTDGLLDLPTIRLLRPILADLQAMRAWAVATVDAFVAAGTCRRELDQWHRHLARIWAAYEGDDSGPTGADAPPLRATEAGTYRRPVRARRDARLATFAHTRRYRQETAAGAASPPFSAEALAMICIQRDELDAIETFANVLYDLGPSPDTHALRIHLARLIWDESRHAEAGHQLLEYIGEDPFAIPCGVLGIHVRAPLPPLLAFAQIHAFGELNQVGHIRTFARTAAAAGEMTLARCFDFIHADELQHCRGSQPWLVKLSERAGTSLAAVQEQARLVAIERLREEGVWDEDYSTDLTPAALGDLLGE